MGGLVPDGVRGRPRVSVTGGRIRLGLFAGVFVLLVINAMVPWGAQTGLWVFTGLPALTGVGAIVCALVVVRRKRGLSKAWRLMVVAAFAASAIGDIIWFAERASTGGTAPPLAVAAYFL